jgi:hypothetical protein
LESDKRTPDISSSSLKQLEQILAKRQGYVSKLAKNPRRSLGLNPTANEVAEVLATLLKDLREQGILK